MSSGMGIVATTSMKSNQLEILFERIVYEDDQQALGTLFNLMSRQLFALCLPIVSSRELADEIVCDVFCNLWRNRKQIKIESSLKAYIITSARNRALDYFRKLKREKKVDLSHASHIACPEENAEDRIDYEKFATSINIAIYELPQQCRQVFILNREYGMKYREIAEKLNISVKTVETHMGRALKHLRQTVLATHRLRN
ncbi:MAG: DNA-directed RNA polymerase sigma-70 factor [Cyclobacteriaceae bacterium]|nr:MAG: DNA-directed RNA polymerase sigma-70 factor [Cyclobacteriaceae bacterium]